MAYEILQGDVSEQLATLPAGHVQCVDDLLDVQLAYLAGFIDGEGHLGIQKMKPQGAATPQYVIRLAFGLGTEEPLKTVSSWLGVRCRRYPTVSAKRQPTWRAQVPKRTTVALLLRCLPYLILKRPDAELALRIEVVRQAHTPSRCHNGATHFRQMPPEAVEEMEWLYREFRSLKSNKRPVLCRTELSMQM